MGTESGDKRSHGGTQLKLWSAARPDLVLGPTQHHLGMSVKGKDYSLMFCGQVAGRCKGGRDRVNVMIEKAAKRRKRLPN